MTHEATVRAFHQIVGVGTVLRDTPRKNCKQAWIWSASSFAAGEAMLKLLPWLKTKQAEAQAALHYLADRGVPDGSRPRSAATKATELRHYRQLRGLKQ